MKIYLFDIAVYRLTEEAYFKDLNKYVKKRIPDYDIEEFLMRVVRDPTDQDAQRVMSEASFHSVEFGGGWRYNEIIGYIRIFKYGSQIRAEYWQTNNKRIVKSRRKLFIIKDNKIVPEVTIKDLLSSSAIAESINLCVLNCKNKLKNRFLDLAEYNTFIKYVDWVSFFEKNSIKS